MRPRAIALATLALGTLLTLSNAAFAAKPALESEPLVPGPIESITLGRPVPNGVCQTGIDPAGAAFIVNYLLPPDDAYYTLIDPLVCPCPTGSLQLNAAHVLLNFRVNCAQPVLVSVVPAVDPNGTGCLEPDPNTLLCGPIPYSLNPGATGNFQFDMPIPQGCCITQKAFLVINFVAPGAGCGTSTTRPRLITTGSCVPCTSYNIYPAGNDELCAAGLPGNPVMWADGDCCATVSADRKSWGQVKDMYR